jgi:hypothetical protein
MNFWANRIDDRLMQDANIQRLASSITRFPNRSRANLSSSCTADRYCENRRALNLG